MHGFEALLFVITLAGTAVLAAHHIGRMKTLRPVRQKARIDRRR